MDGNYIILLRKLLDWEWYSDVNTTRVFLHMLLKANWKDGNFQGQKIERGSFVSSIGKLAQETNLTERHIRKAKKHLKTTGEVTSTSHSKYSVFTVNNYNMYQPSDKLSDKQMSSKRQANDKQVTTIEKGKKEIREEYITSNEVSMSSDADFSREKQFDLIRELFNSVCGSYPRLIKMSERRKKAINARLNTGYTVDDFRKAFEKAEASDFLKGANERNWTATFDWMIADNNMAKILEGNYDNKKQVKSAGSNKFNNFKGREYDYDSLERQLLES